MIAQMVLCVVLIVMLAIIVVDGVRHRYVLQKLRKSKTKFGRYLERRLVFGWSLSQARRLHGWHTKRGYKLTA
ncbi:MAG: hypothetical protein A3D65_02440 [Candidatus Lloydbacteria bacterium RIFCSPHIGHO2_02_FULL_50_13]|uniref:Uncharacterized protein n=1 Tax=Candidatus Lloydbacteria bacterium RIFCSPHIGHO2_02_FULL_50_13 TaxID=1798661 RepID=A0A1G2D778_9BACT|nr:MAG: hypothetical protein A3D65_02440 [Candidatus Lloydbacteria bacterium RIFCSPHIGHO2_02_FULL_50_13]